MALFRAIKPAHAFKSSIFREEIARDAEAIRKAMLEDFERTVKTWEHKVKFKSGVESGASVGGVRIEVFTTDKVYGYVDEGTKPHAIRPKRKGYPLRFEVGGKPKTEPNVILSTNGERGSATVWAQMVHHPGTKAREFTKTIAKSYSKEFRQRMQNALDRAARRFAQ